MRMRVIYTTGCAFELTKWIAFLVVFVMLVHYFIATVFIVDGLSMDPNFETGEYVVANRIGYLTGKPVRGDVVILKYPGDPEHKKYIKRVIGLPGDKIQIINGSFYINDKKLTESYIPEETETNSERTINEVLKADNYFVVGDNRTNSSDSRVWGTAPRADIIGKAVFKIFPNTGVIPDAKY